MAKQGVLLLAVLMLAFMQLNLAVVSGTSHASSTMQAVGPQPTASAALTSKQRSLQQSGADAGRVIAWGNISFTDYVPPAATQGVKSIAICDRRSAVGGLNVFLALLANQSVLAWGGGRAFTPANGTANVTAIAAGRVSAVALLTNGTIVSLSDVYDEQPIPPIAQSNVEAIWASNDFYFARLKSGDFINLDDASQPIAAATAADRVIGVAVGACGNFSNNCWMTLRANGSVIPGSGVSIVPDVVKTGVKAISAPNQELPLNLFVALLNNGSIVQWSYASPSQLSSVQFPLNATIQNFTSITAANPTSWAVTSGQNLIGWNVGDLSDATSKIPSNAQTGAMAVVTGMGMSLVLQQGGVVVGFQGQTLVPAGTSIPTGVSTAATVQQVAAGDSHAMALLVGGRDIQIWGDTDFGQLQLPAEIASRGVVIKQIAAAGDACFALSQQGTVYAWGGLDGNGRPSNLTRVPRDAFANIVKIAAASNYALALHSNGSVIAWGDRGDFPSAVLVNNTSAALADVVDIAAGVNTAIAVFRNGSIVQWGDNSTAPALQNVSSAAVGFEYAAAVLGNGTLVLWRITDTPFTGPPEPADFAKGLRVRNISLTTYWPVMAGARAEWGSVLLENGTVVPVPFRCGGGYCQDKFATPPPDARSGITDVAVGGGFLLAVKTDTTPTSLPPVSPTPQSPANGANQSATISLLMTIPATSQLTANNSLQLQFKSQLTAALASYFQVPNEQVTVQLQVLPATQRRLQQARIPVQASAAITATWPADDSNTPAFLLQQVSNLQQQPAAAIPSSMVQTFDIDTTHVVVNNADTSQLPNNPTVPSNKDAPSASSDKKISTGAIAGIAIACVFGVAAVAALIIVIYRRRNKYPAQTKSGSLSLLQSTPITITSGTTGLVTPDSIKIAGLNQGELFVLATAQNYKWTNASALGGGPMQPVEAGVNDVQLDMLLKQEQQQQQQQDSSSATASQYCSAVQLNKDELRQQVQLLSDGLLGRGATALVFKCLWPSRFGPNALLAAKVLQNGFESDMSVLSSFAYEANLLAATQHPHVVKLYGYCLEPPTVCLILELLPCSLKDVLYKTVADTASSNTAKLSSTAGVGSTIQASVIKSSIGSQPTQALSASSPATATGFSAPQTTSSTVADASCTIVPAPSESAVHPLKPVTLQQIVRVCTDVAAGLAYLHNQPAPDATTNNMNRLMQSPSVSGRIVHRDMKPANILLNSQGAAKISDFGLARQHDHTTFATINLGAGTLPYMAPELLVSSRAGVSGAACTNRVDIYSLGIIMWELLTGQPPWKGMAPTAILAAVMNRRRLPLPGDGQDQDREHATMDVPLLHNLPAHAHPDLPKLCQIIQACWQHRELRRPTAVALHGTLSALLQQLEQEEQQPATQ